MRRLGRVRVQYVLSMKLREYLKSRRTTLVYFQGAGDNSLLVILRGQAT
jgi:hypothetical protein